MADIESIRASDPAEFQTSECVDHAPARDTGTDLGATTALCRRRVSSRDLPRFSRTSLQ